MLHITRPVLIISCILILLFLNFAASLGQSEDTGGDSRSSGSQSSDTGGDSRSSGSQSSDTGGDSMSSGSQSSDTDGDSMSSGSQSSDTGGGSFQPTSTSTIKYFEVKKDKDPSEPEKRDNITITLDVYSYTKDINVISLEDEIPIGSEFVSSDPPHDYIKLSKPNMSGNIIWNHSYSEGSHPGHLKFKYTIKINKKYNKNIGPATISWKKNGGRKEEWSNEIAIDIPNSPPKFENDPGPIYNIFGYGDHNIKALISDPDEDNVSSFLYIKGEKIKPHSVINETNEFSWYLPDLPSEKEIFIEAEDEEGMRERKLIKIENPLDFIKNFMDYLHVLAVILAAIIGAIITFTLKNNKPNIKKIFKNIIKYKLSPIKHELDSINRSIEEIGQTNACITTNAIQETRKALIDGGYKGAIAYASSLVGTDQNTELLRVLIICEKNKLTPGAAILVLDNLSKIESGKWENGE